MITYQIPAIDHGIPIPPKWKLHFRYPWIELKPGDSFVWPGTPENARAACRVRRKRHGEQYRVAKVTEDGKHMIRIWRVA